MPRERLHTGAHWYTLHNGVLDMHFRIPQTLDGFEASAVSGNMVSKESMSRVRLCNAVDLSSIRACLKQLQTKPQAQADHDTAWSEDSCSEAYGVLCTVATTGWPSAPLLRALACFLSEVGAFTVRQGSIRSGRMPAEASLGLAIFFTCQMLQHTEVCFQSNHAVYPHKLSYGHLHHHNI